MKETIVEINELQVLRRGREILAIDELVIEKGELVGLLGPNGAGKSTLLQMLNLQLPYQKGSVKLFSEEAALSDPVALRRRCAMVFQETLLLSGTVFDNVALALRFRGLADDVIKSKVNEALNTFHCAHLSGRLARRLSGGEAQRVCLARALVAKPELLLLDEPFAALDAATRGNLLREVKTVAQRHKMTVLLVSHNFQEILAFAERALVLLAGKLVQDERPDIVLRRPVCREAAHLVEMDNLLSATAETSAGGARIRLENGLEFHVPGCRAAGACLVCIPGDAFSLAETEREEDGFWSGQVIGSRAGIGVQCVEVSIAGLSLAIRLDWRKKLETGDALCLRLVGEQVHIIN
ncbi:ABC transporter ATP-binding protein [Azotosporobacter soli]|uniref:ABC transporter ATP-binding protein n=1 Tax=Azotosporobacter soli TaxID=3055040 RepID=UPI0031FEEA5D